MSAFSSQNALGGGRTTLGVGFLGIPGNLAQIWATLHRSRNQLVCIASAGDVLEAQSFVSETLRRLAEGEKEELARVPPPRVVESFREVLQAPGVEVVYLALPSADRQAWLRRCVQAHKHVIGGAHFAAAANAEELLRGLDEMCGARLLYLDGTPCAHGGRAIERMQELLHTLGPMKHVEVCSGVPRPPSQLLAADAHDSLGVLGHLGWEALSTIFCLLDFSVPARVSGRIARCAPDGAITAFEAELQFDRDGAPVTALVDCRYEEEATGTAPERHLFVLARDGVLEAEEVHADASKEAKDLSPARSAKMEVRVRRSSLRCTTATCDTSSPAACPHSVDSPVVIETCTTEECLDSLEASGAEAMWCHLQQSLTQLSADGKLLIEPDKGGEWGRRVYLTQLVLDKLLETAMSWEGKKA